MAAALTIAIVYNFSKKKKNSLKKSRSRCQNNFEIFYLELKLPIGTAFSFTKLGSATDILLFYLQTSYFRKIFQLLLISIY